MTKPSDIISFGGVKFDSNEIQLKRNVKENGKNMYEVVFKTGGSIKYPQQATKNNSSVFIQFEESSGSHNYVAMHNISGAQYKGSEEYQDIIHLGGCNNCTIDVRGGNNYLDNMMPPGGDAVIIHKEGANKSFGNKVLTDSQDDVLDGVFTGDGIWTRGAGIHQEDDKSDINNLHIFNNMRIR